VKGKEQQSVAILFFAEPPKTSGRDCEYIMGYVSDGEMFTD
jgi:hypothetical protein